MRRVCALIGMTFAALAAQASVARAATAGKLGGGEVTSLSVVPAAGRAEVVVAVDGSVDVDDFSLASPPRIVLDLRGAKLATAGRMYDRIARGGITNVRVAQYRDNIVRLVIDLDGQHSYTVNRTLNEVHVVLDPNGTTKTSFTAWRASAGSADSFDATPDAAPSDRDSGMSGHSTVRLTSHDASTAASSQPRITVTYQDTDIKDVIAGFAVFSGRTIVAGKGVTGNVSAEVRDQPWDVALRAILSSQGYAAKEDADGIISVDSYENIAKQQATEPVQTRIISVNYARASSLVSTVKSLLSKDCPVGAAGPNGATSGSECKTRGDVTADSGTNRLLVTDVPSRLEEIANYVKDLDVRTPQVSIKTKIILVDRTNIQDIGVSYDLGDNGTFFNKLVQRTDPSTFKPIDTNGDGVPDAVVGTPFPSNTQVINIGGNSLAAISNATQRVVDPALSLIFSTALGKFNLTAFLDGLQEVRLSDVEAEPSIVTLDNREAQILSGEETPIRIVDLGSLSQGGTGGTAPRATVQFKETGIILKVTPHITNNRKILMTLHAERSQLQPAASDLGYTFLKQSADNELLVGDGETAVIGGLTTTQVQQSKSGIPLLVDLPFIGKLFGETRTQEDKTDLLILVTPHIVDDGDAIGAPGGDR
ncbi:MAG TPA: AMIN domain-containing protein [Gemmatimonadaceae bacterium]|nr:AMIN domain-containing protein [Gemmatimonadaceae bacterium]